MSHLRRQIARLDADRSMLDKFYGHLPGWSPVRDVHGVAVSEAVAMFIERTKKRRVTFDDIERHLWQEDEACRADPVRTRRLVREYAWGLAAPDEEGQSAGVVAIRRAYPLAVKKARRFFGGRFGT